MHEKANKDITTSQSFLMSIKLFTQQWTSPTLHQKISSQNKHMNPEARSHRKPEASHPPRLHVHAAHIFLRRFKLEFSQNSRTKK